MKMPVRFLPLLTVLLFFVSQVSSDDIRNEDQSIELVKGANRRLFQYLDSGDLCKGRCNLHSRPKMCNRACGTCCVRCRCVPPGTSGNREVCGRCYADMTTHGNRTKCPWIRLSGRSSLGVLSVVYCSIISQYFAELTV